MKLDSDKKGLIVRLSFGDIIILFTFFISFVCFSIITVGLDVLNLITPIAGDLYRIIYIYFVKIVMNILYYLSFLFLAYVTYLIVKSFIKNKLRKKYQKSDYDIPSKNIGVT